jgi:hypothetical protein
MTNTSLRILQQYSEEVCLLFHIIINNLIIEYQATNTPIQIEQALRNFDLTDYGTIFADLIVHLYDEILRGIKEK